MKLNPENRKPCMLQSFRNALLRRGNYPLAAPDPAKTLMMAAVYQGPGAVNPFQKTLCPDPVKALRTGRYMVFGRRQMLDQASPKRNI